jgi:zinc transport system substrate-binding protein
MLIRFCVVGFMVALVGTACSPTGAADDRPDVAVAVYPLEFVAERVGGAGVAVSNVTPAAAEPHDLELTPSQVVAVSEADLLVYLGGGFQPTVEDLARDLGDRAMDVSDDAASDPHVWLDPTRLAAVGSAIADRLEVIDPDGDGYRERAERLAAELSELDAEYESGLADCTRRELVTSHEAFGYLADRYGLRQIGITGIDTEAEPSPQGLAEVADFVRERRVEVIYSERLLPADLAETIAAESGARTAVLDPLESQPQEGDYFTAMRANLQALRGGLGCR